jgi:hypothetical protein
VKYKRLVPRILEWTEADIEGLSDSWGLTRVVTELDEDNFVTRELGFDAVGSLVHRYPGAPCRAKHGVFDMTKVGPSNRSDMEAEEFERLWWA